MAFRSQLKIRFGDIDRAGIVYYPRFLHYFHVALEEFFGNELGIEYTALVNDYQIGLPTVHLETDFKRPFTYGDEIEVEVSVIKVGRTSITFRYRTFKKGEDTPRNTGYNVTVCLDMETLKKREMPDWLRKRLEAKVLRPSP